MNDDEMLTALRSSLTGAKDSLSGVRMDRPVSSITGKAVDRRLWRGVSAAAAGGLALGVGLGFGLFSGGHAASKGVHVNLDGFTVNTTANGLVDVTIGDLKDPAALRQVLAEAGVPAIVNVGKFCSGGRSLPQVQKVVVHEEHPPRETIFLLNPSAVPADTELDFGLAAHTKAQPAKPSPGLGTRANPSPVLSMSVLSLIRDGAKLTCQPLP